MKIELANREHIPQIHTLEGESFSCPRSLKALYEDFENPMCLFVVAIKNFALIGYGSMHIICGEGYIDNLAVNKDFRRCGVGSAIIKALYQNTHNFLSLEVRESNMAAQGLYESEGFVLKGKRIGYYENPRENGLIYTLEKGEATNDNTGN